MKELNFEQMEKVNGGGAREDALGITVSCMGGAMLLIGTGVATVLSGGLLGWGFAISAGVAAAGCGASVASSGIGR